MERGAAGPPGPLCGAADLPPGQEVHWRVSRGSLSPAPPLEGSLAVPSSVGLC